MGAFYNNLDCTISLEVNLCSKLGVLENHNVLGNDLRLDFTYFKLTKKTGYSS